MVACQFSHQIDLKFDWLLLKTYFHLWILGKHRRLGICMGDQVRHRRPCLTGPLCMSDMHRRLWRQEGMMNTGTREKRPKGRHKQRA